MELRDNGQIVHDGILIGTVTPGPLDEKLTEHGENEASATIVLNAGWCAGAGVRVTVQGNPNVEGRRIVFDRAPGAQPGHRATATDQQALDTE